MKRNAERGKNFGLPPAKPLILLDQKDSWQKSTNALAASLILGLVPPAGTPVMTVIAWGGDGASVLRLTWLRGRRGRVQGFPCRHYGRCVLDEHIAGEANAERPKKPEAKCIEGGAERTRTEIAGRAAARSRLFSLIGVRTAARLPDFFAARRMRSVLGPQPGCESRAWRR